MLCKVHTLTYDSVLLEVLHKSCLIKYYLICFLYLTWIIKINLSIFDENYYIEHWGNYTVLTETKATLKNCYSTFANLI